MKLKVKALEPC